METIKCVVVDDLPAGINMLRNFINTMSEIELSESFEEPLQAIDYIQDNPQISLVFVDYEMPNMDGIQMIKELQGRGCRQAFVLMTGHNESYFEASDKEVLAGFMEKPVSGRGFRKFVADFTDRKNQVI